MGDTKIPPKKSQKLPFYVGFKIMHSPWSYDMSQIKITKKWFLRNFSIKKKMGNKNFSKKITKAPYIMGFKMMYSSRSYDIPFTGYNFFIAQKLLKSRIYVFFNKYKLSDRKFSPKNHKSTLLYGLRNDAQPVIVQPSIQGLHFFYRTKTSKK